MQADPPSSRALSEPRVAEQDLKQQAVPSDTYPVLDEPLAIEFANTLFTTAARPLDALTSQMALRRWLDVNAERIDTPSPRRLTAGDLERALELREIIRVLFACAVADDPPPAGSVQHLNQIAALDPITPRLHWTAAEPPKAHPSLSRLGRVDALFALLAQSAIDVLGGSGAGRLRRCEAPGCINYYLKDHPRREWCSPKCGNRVRAARHYQRTRRSEP